VAGDATFALMSKLAAALRDEREARLGLSAAALPTKGVCTAFIGYADASWAAPGALPPRSSCRRGDACRFKHVDAGELHAAVQQAREADAAAAAAAARARAAAERAAAAAAVQALPADALLAPSLLASQQLVALDSAAQPATAPAAGTGGAGGAASAGGGGWRARMAARMASSAAP
jgi:hypothetical protein